MKNEKFDLATEMHTQLKASRIDEKMLQAIDYLKTAAEHFETAENHSNLLAVGEVIEKLAARLGGQDV